MTENKKTVERYLEGFRRSDHAMVLSCLTNDVEWVIPGMFHIQGKEAFDKEIENQEFTGSPKIVVTRLTEEDDVVLAEGTVRAQRKDGGVLHLVFCDVFEMAGAKIKKLTSYLMEVNGEKEANDAAVGAGSGACRMKIVEFAFIVYPSTNLARSREFYEEVLGFTSTTLIERGDQFWIEYEVGPHTLGLGNEPFLKPSGDGPHLVLEVDDYDQTIEHLRRHRVPFAVEPFEMPGCRGAIVVDPDGNKLGLHKRKA